MNILFKKNSIFREMEKMAFEKAFGVIKSYSKIKFPSFIFSETIICYSKILPRLTNRSWEEFCQDIYATYPEHHLNLYRNGDELYHSGEDIDSKLILEISAYTMGWLSGFSKATYTI